MMQSFIRLFANHRVAPNLLMLLLFLAGAYGLKQLNTQFFPTFAIDTVKVFVAWPGAAAEDVQNSITIPLEQELKNVANVTKVKSSTSRGGVSIILDVDSSADFTETTNAIKQRVDAVGNLPAEAETPTIEQFVMYENVGTVLITAAGPVEELTGLARQAERELLAKGISKINFTGLPEQEIAIQIEPSTIHDLGLSLRNIAGLINNQSQDVMAGTAGRSDGSKQLRAIGKVSNVSSFE
ncbi:MAG: multidrug efflux pump subunit AcrB, partial [Candidatus Paceibacteria bacterium]